MTKILSALRTNLREENVQFLASTEIASVVFRENKNQSLLFEPILNNTKQFHEGQKFFAVDTQSAERSTDLKEMVLSFVYNTKFKVKNDIFQIGLKLENLNNLF